MLLDGFAEALGLGADFTFAGGGGGSLQDSASSAALVALLAALHRRTPEWRVSGVTGRERVYVSAETHSSLAKAVRVAGLGEEALRVVPFEPGTLTHERVGVRRDAGRWTRPTASSRRSSARPSGTTGTGSVDPCATSPPRRAEHEVWVHVDAAWAGVAALCPEHRDVVDGADLVDSFCTDAHKWLFTAFDASFLWVRDGQALPDALSITPEYLRNAASDSGQVVDYRDWQVPLGRRMRALKLWSVRARRRARGAARHDPAPRRPRRPGWPTRCARATGFRLPVEPSLALVCLQVAGPDGEPDDDATRARHGGRERRPAARSSPTPSSTGTTRSGSRSVPSGPSSGTSSGCGTTCRQRPGPLASTVVGDPS